MQSFSNSKAWSSACAWVVGPRSVRGDRASTRPRDADVVEPDRRLVIAAVSIGVVFGALLASSSPREQSAASAGAFAERAPAAD